MPRSKLESYEAVLGALVNGPLTFEQIAFETSIECVALGKRLDFLMVNALVEARHSEDEERYAMTERGIAVLKALNFQKYLEQISDRLTLIDDAMQVISSQREDLHGHEE